MTVSFAEYQDISVVDPLRQGDVLEAADPAASLWQRHLVVLTADCDLARAKHHGRVTCIPVLTEHEYLLEMQIPGLRDKAMNKFVDELRKALPPAAPKITDERLRAWPCEEEPDEIAAALGLSGRRADDVKAACESIRLLSRQPETLDDAVKLLIDSQVGAPNPQKRDKIVDGIVNKFRNAYSNPPGDALFLSSIAPRNSLGYFAYLRHPEQVPEAEIALGPDRSASRYRRISRLQDRYTHALVERFAHVFMSIGLPSAYEDVRDLHSEYLGAMYK
jgi:hypothetical protein